MRVRISLLVLLGIAIFLAASARGAKKPTDRAMLEKMEAVPCGAHEKGLTGIGAVWASVGVTSVNSNEKFCQQYVVRSDEMEYRIQPTDKKHPPVLPIGHEIVYQIRKDEMIVKVADSHEKARSFLVVAAQPTAAAQSSADTDDRVSSR